MADYNDVIEKLRAYLEIANGIEQLKKERAQIDAQIAEAEVKLLSKCSSDLVGVLASVSVDDLLEQKRKDNEKPIPFPLFDVKQAIEEESDSRSRFHYGTGTRPKRYRKGTNLIETEWRDHSFRTAARALGLSCPMENRNGAKLIYTTVDEEEQIREWIRNRYPERYKGGR